MTILIWIVLGCSRDVGDKATSVLRITAPSSQKLGALAAPPSGFKVCYGVNVTAEDINNTASTCGPSLGSFQGFVKADSNLTVEVPSGVNRKVELFAYMSTNTDAKCPTWTADCTSSVHCSLYRVASAEAVDMEADEVTVTMEATFPTDLDQNIVATDSTSSLCTSSVRGGLNMAGEILDSSFSVLGTPSTNLASSSVYENSAGTGFEAVTRSMASTESATFTPLPQIRAISRKPDTGELYGMTASHELVKMAADGTYSSLTNCPFATCQLPIWFKSFSMGNGVAVFGLDWGGSVWQVDSSTSVTQKSSGIPLHVQQVVFY